LGTDDARRRYEEEVASQIERIEDPIAQAEFEEQTSAQTPGASIP
jgi:hypothetical protein